MKQSLIFTAVLAMAMVAAFAGASFAEDSNAVVVASSSSVAAVAIIKDAPVVSIPVVYGRIQGVGIAELETMDTNTNRQALRIFEFLKQARFGAKGNVGGVDYKFEGTYGGDATAIGKVGILNDLVNLADAYMDFNVMSLFRLRIGQFKVPYSRESLAADETMQFSTTSINTLGFTLGRDVGLAAYTSMNNIVAGLALVSGGGGNVPIRTIPEKMGVPMLALRVGYDDLNKDMFDVNQLNVGLTGTHFAAYINGMFEKNSRVGHGSSMTSKQIEKSLFYNSAWNTYLGNAFPNFTADIGELWQLGADVACQMDVAGGKLTGSAEFNTGKFVNYAGVLNLTAATAQAGFYINGMEIACRYAILLPDTNLINTGTKQYMSADPIHEITPALNFYIVGQNVKLIMDMQILIGAPIIFDANGGQNVIYNAILVPDSVGSHNMFTGTGTNANMPRYNSYVGRMMVQLAF